MGAVKAWLEEQQELRDIHGPELEPEPENEYERALEVGWQNQGESNDFVNSCARFYSKNRYLTERQMEFLRRDPKRSRERRYYL